MLLDAVPFSEKEFQQVSDLVYKHCKINLHEGKRELIQARLSKQLRAGGFTSVTDYLAYVTSEPTGAAMTQMIDSLSTNLTSFFRENGHFDYLSNTHLPALLTRKRSRNINRIRAWSAGCSSGEEPYTLAIVLAEALAGGTWDARILATDISTKVLATASAGIYDATRVQSVPADLRRKYFNQRLVETRPIYEVSAGLRQMVAIRHLNLMEEWPFSGPFDFIFCRNVMIYFDKPTQHKLVNRYYDILDSGGLLFTGHSESLTGISHRFSYVQPTVYRKP